VPSRPAEGQAGLSLRPAPRSAALPSYAGGPIGATTFVAVFKHRITGQFTAELPDRPSHLDHVAVSPEQVAAWKTATRAAQRPARGRALPAVRPPPTVQDPAGQPITAASFTAVYKSRVTGQFAAELPGKPHHRDHVAVSPEQVAAWTAATRAAQRQARPGPAVQPRPVAQSAAGQPITAATFAMVYKNRRTGEYTAELPGKPSHHDHIAITEQQVAAWKTAVKSSRAAPAPRRIPLENRSYLDIPLKELPESIVKEGRTCPFTLEPYGKELSEPVVFFSSGKPQIAEFAKLKEWVQRGRNILGAPDPLSHRGQFLDESKIFRVPKA
jgi:hypothetical protein